MAKRKSPKKPPAPPKELTVRELASLGGKARAAKMTAEQRKASSQKAIQSRWAKARAAKKKQSNNEGAKE